MKRTPVLLVFACAIASLSMLSCDAMFENNLFGGMTHKKLTTDSIKSQSPSELKETLDSEQYQEQIAEDSELEQAILDQLEDAYDGSDGDGDPGTAEGQTAAILAADIIISSDPAASQLTAGSLGAIETIIELQDSIPEGGEPTQQQIEDAFAEIMNEILPLDIQTALQSGAAEPPQSFVQMITAFSDASAAYEALNDGLGPSGTYLADVGENEPVEIAFNALISGFISLVEPAAGMAADPLNPTDEEVAQAIWSAITDPDNIERYIVPPTDAYQDLLGDGGSLSNIMQSVESMFGNA